MKSNFLKRSTLLVVFLFAGISLSAQETSLSYEDPSVPPSPRELLDWKEVFTYEVRYSFFKLGEVKVEIISDTLYNNQKSWHLNAVITSNSGIPFVGEEENHYNSIFTEGTHTFKVLEFWTDNVDEDEYRTSNYIFDRAEQRVYAHEKDQPPDTLSLEDPAVSGPTTFYLSRLTAGTDSVLKIPIYLNQEKKYLTLTNTTEIEKREYEAFDGQVETYYTRGNTDVDGPFGFSGEFDSWYLTDDLRVPVEAHVKVWLGKAKIRLIDYKKERRK